MQPSPLTIHEWLIENTVRLKNVGIESARLDCLLLLEYALNVSREWLIANDDKIISEPRQEQLNVFITQREKRMPLAYIIGSKEFYGREFLVNEDILIPRPESEAIIDLAIKASAIYKPNTIIDVGTGSGCLAITLKKELKNIHVTGIDVSLNALKIAKKNATKHKADIQWRHFDIISKGIPVLPKTRPYILVVNLPYVPNNMISSPEITKEPNLALFSGDDGLDHYRTLWRSIDNASHKPALVITESLLEQHDSLQKLALESGYHLLDVDVLVQVFKPIP